MLQDLKKLGREYLLTGSIVDTVTDKKPTKQELINLKLNKVLSSAKQYFREQPPRITKCRKSLMEVLVILISKGVELKESEMTEIFFAATQLFQIKDWPVRRLIYVLLDHLNPDAQEAFIVTAALIKEVEKGEGTQRAKAIRRFTRVDVNIATQLEGQMKNAILDKDPVVSSSALAYGDFLYYIQPEIVRRWTTEVNTALQRNQNMAQAHAVRLLFTIKKGDRLALMKQVKTLADRSKTTVLHNVTLVYTIQQAEKLLLKNAGTDKDFEEYILNFLVETVHSPDCVAAFQSAKSLVRLAISSYNIDNKVSLAIDALKFFLQHNNVTYRFGAIRALHLVSQHLPEILIKHTDEIQEFHKLQQAHPTLAILAISTLLNAGNESNVDRLLDAIQTQGMSDMPDAFRLDVIRAIRTLSNKYPQQYATFLNYLQSHTREDRSLQFKELLIQSIIEIGERTPEAFVRCLDILCEFIEDSEYAILTSYSIDKITEMIGNVEKPEAYVRFIFNRLILETANVRASALTSLTLLGRQFPTIRNPVINLINLHSVDMDDGIRDLSINCKQSLIAHDTDSASTRAPSDDIFDLDLIDGDELDDLRSLYWGDEVPTPTAMSNVGVAIGDISHLSGNSPDARTVGGDAVEVSPTELVSIMAEICPLDNVRIKNVVKKLPLTSLTEAEAEYLVDARVQFLHSDGCGPNKCLVAIELLLQNTLEDIVLLNMSPQLLSHIDGIEPLASTNVDSLEYGDEKYIYMLLMLDTQATFVDQSIDKISLPLQFMFEVDENGASYEDSYEVEPIILEKSSFP